MLRNPVSLENAKVTYVARTCHTCGQRRDAMEQHARTHTADLGYRYSTALWAIAIRNRKYATPRAVSRLDISKSSSLLYHPTSEPQQSGERGHSRHGKPFQGLVTTLPRVLSVTRNITPNLGLCLLTKSNGVRAVLLVSGSLRR